MKKLPDKMTYGECYDPAVSLATTDPEKAIEWFQALVERRVRLGGVGGESYTPEEAEALERSNIGYFAGYYGEAERRTVMSVYKIARHNSNFPTYKTEEAYEAGRGQGK